MLPKQMQIKEMEEKFPVAAKAKLEGSPQKGWAQFIEKNNNLCEQTTKPDHLKKNFFFFFYWYPKMLLYFWYQWKIY